MSKNLLQDMVKVKRVREKTRPVLKKEEEPDLQVEQKEIKIKTSKPRYKIWFVAIFSIGFCLFAVSYLFSSATITVNPKIQSVNLNDGFSANKNSGAEGLSFDLVVISGEESKVLKANSEKDVAEKATGTVVIYNAFGPATQLLSVDTRLEGSNGKIYKTVKKIVVPGMKGNVPGSIEVGIYGAEAGVEYNSEPLDFKIFGFKGTPKYSKIYARSKGEIQGGFVGKAPVVSDVDRDAAIVNLKTALQAKLLKEVAGQIPSGFVLFKDAIFLNTNNLNGEPNVSSVYNKDNSLTLTLRGTLDGILLDEKKLTKKIIEGKIDDYDGSLVYISNIRDMVFSIPLVGDIPFRDTKSIYFNLKGDAKVVWKVDTEKLTKDLLGKPKKDFSQVLLGYLNIDSADLVVNPFWRTSLPEKSKDIKVIVNYPK